MLKAYLQWTEIIGSCFRGLAEMAVSLYKLLDTEINQSNHNKHVQ